MRHRRVLALVLVVLALGLATVGFIERRPLAAWYGTFRAQGGVKGLFYCPMHPSITSDRRGKCPICGMDLVEKKNDSTPAPHKSGEKSILYYRNPMNPQVTSSVPMKDEMGMDYIPVYAEEGAATHPGVYISPEKQQLIGVRKGKVERRRLTGEILTVGRVAYDPTLFTAQQEYLQVLRGRQSAGQGGLNDYVGEQAASLLKAARSRLLLLGMSDAEIGELEKQGKPESNLYLPTRDDRNIWVYVTIYEYEAGMVSEGMPVRVEAPPYPGQVFEGRIVSIAPVLDAATRTLKARTLVDNPDGRLKLEMYVNVRISFDLGDKLAVPEDAVMRAGTRDIVYRTDPNGYFTPVTVTLGARAQGYYEVLLGLAANDEVVTSANFLVDSESKLNAVLSQMGEPNQPAGGHQHD